jgi:hypothetical protein
MPQDLTAKQNGQDERPQLSWKPTDLVASMTKLADDVEKNVIAASDWYMAKRKLPSMGARWSRLLAILFVTLGGLAPLITSTFNLDVQKLGVTGTGIGYLFLAVAAACIALDRYAGFSSAWMRRVTTAQAIKRLLVDFRVQWPALLAEIEAKPGGVVTTADVKPLFDRVAKLAGDAEDLITEETRLWKVEFESAFAQLEKATQAQKSEPQEQKPTPLKETPRPLVTGEKATVGEEVRMKVSRSNAGAGGGGDAGGPGAEGSGTETVPGQDAAAGETPTEQPAKVENKEETGH